MQRIYGGAPVIILGITEENHVIFQDYSQDIDDPVRMPVLRVIPVAGGQVEQALRGLRTGQRYTIREWSGLWMSAPHYRLGQRMMLFHYGPSRAGLTSPVEGSLGRYDIDRSGQGSIFAPRRPAVAGCR